MTALGRDLDVIELGDDRFAVPSRSTPGRHHAVVVDVDDHGLAHCLCGCQAGSCHPDQPIPCRHAAAVIERLVAQRHLRRIGALAYQIPTLH